MNWYVIQATTGKELIVKKQLQDHKIHAIVPKENRLIRTKGNWIEKEYILIPGYVFIEADFTDNTYHTLKNLNFVIRILPGNGKVEKLSTLDIALLAHLEDVEPSIVDFSTTPPTVLKGLLKDLKCKNISFDKHSRRAKVVINIGNKEHCLNLSVIPSQQEANCEHGLIRPHITEAL